MILITGATGKVGCDLVQQLMSRGEDVRALVRDPLKAAKALPEHVELSAGDLLDGASLDEALDGVEKMFLLSPPDERMATMEKTAIEAARRAGLKHVVKLSVVEADPASRSFFLRSHGEVEHALQNAGVPFTLLRANFFMQNLLGLAEMAKGGTIYQPADDEKANHVDTTDIASTAAQVLTSAGHAGQTYLLTGPQAVSFHDIAGILSRLTSKEVKYQSIPRDAAKGAMKQGGMPEWQAEAISQLMDDYRAGKMARVSDDVEKVTGKKARSVAEFLECNSFAFTS